MAIRHTLALCALTVGLAACGTPTVTSTPDDIAAKEAAISAPSGASTIGASEDTTPQAAAVGDIITLVDNTGSQRIAVKVAKVINSGSAANDLIKPEAGNRLYGIEVILKNTGTNVLNESPGSGAKVVDSEGQEYEKSLFGEIAGAHNLGEITLAPGKVRKGVIVFEVPKNAKITEFLMALSSGYADQKGSWTLN